MFAETQPSVKRITKCIAKRLGGPVQLGSGVSDEVEQPHSARYLTHPVCSSSLYNTAGLQWFDSERAFVNPFTHPWFLCGRACSETSRSSLSLSHWKISWRFFSAR
jgi:hypothetical protein